MTPPIITADAAAPLIGLTSGRHVRHLCRRHNVGLRISPRVLLLTAADIERLRKIRANNPVGHPVASGKRKKPPKN